MEADKRPSKKQKELLEYIEGFIKTHGYGPSYREIMRALSYKSVSTVAVHIDGLIKKGHLVKRDHSARSLAVVGAASARSTNGAAGPSTEPEKWLLAKVTNHFDQYSACPSRQKYDELCVLTGALTVLGMQGAAADAKSRLDSLQQQA